LYFQIARHLHCSKNIISEAKKFLKNNQQEIFDLNFSEKIINKDATDINFIEYFCTKILYESNKLYASFRDPNRFARDLLIEQRKLNKIILFTT
jgi:hypothetical protein